MKKLPAGVVALAKGIVASRDFDALPILADAIEETDDLRGDVIRKHSHCCFRGMGIAMNIEESGNCYDSAAVESKKTVFAWRGYGSDPKTWDCLKR